MFHRMILLAQLALLSAVVAAPVGPCHVQIVPADAPRAWLVAASSLQRELSAATLASDHDCRAVVIRATVRDASIEVTTADGRRAVRAVADADDLEPTVTALIVTLPVEPPVLARRTVPTAAEETASRAPAAPEPLGRLLVYAGGGARLTLQGSTGPVLELMAGTIRGRWELALAGGWAPGLIGAGADAALVPVAELGLAVARRRPTSFGALIAGGRVSATLALQDTEQGGNNPDPGPSDSGPLGSALAGFVGCAVRVGSFVRLRPQLTLEWIPPPRAGGPSAPSMWSLGLSVGAEGSVP